MTDAELRAIAEETLECGMALRLLDDVASPRARLQESDAR